MDKASRRILILDCDPATLITLQHVLEDAEIDVTITWDEAEACQLLETAPYDLLLIGHHPPELNAGAILDNLSLRGTCPSVFILLEVISENDRKQFRRLGATGVVLRRDSLVVLEEVKKAWDQMPSKASGEDRSFRAAA